MRKFNDFEQDILKRISKIFKEQNLENVDLAKIIRTELDAFAVEWDNEKGETTIFCVEQNMAKDYFLKLLT